jgi:methylenetetrahydrofolate dehydrogenase (NADP+)/methenyltetrahydrofolate cyclohydrolase
MPTRLLCSVPFPFDAISRRHHEEIMAATILDGSAIAATIQDQVKQQVLDLRGSGCQPKLAAVMVGEPAASVVYARSQARQCERLGIAYELIRLPAQCDADCLRRCIHELNRNDEITGIMLHLPLPPWIEAHQMHYEIDPYKDVEGVNPANIGFVFYGQPIIAPCTALSVVELVNASGISLRGANAVVVGQGPIVGRPVSVLLIQREATVSACNEFTKPLPEYTRHADLLVVAVGKAGLIGSEHVKPGGVVIDVGINRVTVTDDQGNETSKTVGDVDYEAVVDKVGAITPVPGGVGPVTVSMLLRNTVESARKQLERKS